MHEERGSFPRALEKAFIRLFDWYQRGILEKLHLELDRRKRTRNWSRTGAEGMKGGREDEQGLDVFGATRLSCVA